MKKIVIGLFLVVVTVIMYGQNALEALDIAKIQSITDVKITDDGSLIAFLRSVPADPLKENKPAEQHLYVYDVATEKTIPFFTRMSVRNLAFRPKHGSMTFITKMQEDKVSSLYEISPAGGEAVKLLEFETAIAAYEWSKDGEELLFLADEPKEEEDSDLPYEPIVYEENLTFTKIYRWSPDLEKPKKLMLDGDVKTARWSPKGDKIAVLAAPTPLVDDYYMAQRLFLVDADNPKTIAEVDHAGKKGSIAWSPDGSKLAMIAGADIHDPIDGRLFVVDATTGQLNNLMPAFKGAFEGLTWMDDKRLQALASVGVSSLLGEIQSDGNAFENPFEPKGFNIIDFERAATGTIALIADTPHHPAEVYLLPPGAKGNPQRITNSNSWLDEKDMGRQEVVTYKARDGMELQGILIHPINAEKGKRYPLVTVVHGGPEAHYDNGWLTYYATGGHMLAADGYLVFYPNYRGSTGRGVEFAMSSQGDLAGKEFDDVVDGVDYLIERGLADKEKVGVTGGSYGGYATGWMATRYTDRFAAGVMFVGISDNISKWGTSDIPEELYLVHARKRIWEDYEFFLKRSPIYYAGQAKTPLLIMAGAEDTRVDPSQSMELYRHIKTRTDTPVRLVLYPGEGHGNRNASARLDFTRRMTSWFDQYLKKETAKP